MFSPPNKLRISTLLFALLSASHVQAATLTVLGSAPTVDGADIHNLNATSTGGDIINGDRPAAGQSFLTLGNAGGYELTSFTVMNRRSVGASGGTWNIRIGTISGTNFTEIATDTVTVGGSALTLSGSGDDFIRFEFTTPFTLAANTLYGIDLVRTGAGNYLTFGENAAPGYADGQSYTSSPNGLGGPTVSFQASTDRVFHLDMTAIPEPGVALLSGLGVMLLLRRRKH